MPSARPSSAAPTWPSAVRVRQNSRTLGSAYEPAVSGVSIDPGQITLARILCGPQVLATLQVREMMPPLLAA